MECESLVGDRIHFIMASGNRQLLKTNQTPSISSSLSSWRFETLQPSLIEGGEKILLD